MARPRAWFPVVVLLGATLVPWLMAEGIYSLARGPQAETSLAWSLIDGLSAESPPGADPDDPATLMLTDTALIKALLPAMKAAGVGLGNSPFSELKTEAASINSEQGECLEQKPNLRKRVGFLRTNLFNPFDQMTFFVDADRELPPELERFFARYAFRVVTHSTNGFGERTTLPAVDASPVVLVAGDSVANGLMLDDGETLASQLQAREQRRIYVNLGIARASAADSACALERAAKRYAGRLDEVIYVLCENDFEQGGRGSAPDDLVAALEAYRERHGVARVSLVIAPYIYNTVPEVTRVRGHSHYRWPSFREERARTAELARARGFRVVDFMSIANEERRRGASQFAPLALYLDHAHWSPAGVARVVEALDVR